MSSFTTGNAFKQKRAFENARISEEKSKIVKSAFALAANTLSSAFGKVAIDFTEDTMVEVKPSTYSGNIKSSVAINTDEGIKRIALNFSVENSIPTIKNKEFLIKRVSEQLLSVPGSISEKLAQYKKAQENRIATIDTEVAQNEEIAKRIEAGVDVKEAYASVYSGASIKKESKDFTMQDLDATLNNIFGSIPETITYSKANLPSNIEIGDTIDLKGFRYEVSASSPALSSGKNDGTHWILKLKS